MGLDSPLGTKSILLIPDNQRICFLADVLFESRAEKVRKGLGTKDPLVVVPHRLDLQLAFGPSETHMFLLRAAVRMRCSARIAISGTKVTHPTRTGSRSIIQVISNL